MQYFYLSARCSQFFFAVFFLEIPHAEEAGKQTSNGQMGVTPLKTPSPTLRSP